MNRWLCSLLLGLWLWPGVCLASPPEKSSPVSLLEISGQKLSDGELASLVGQGWERVQPCPGSRIIIWDEWRAGGRDQRQNPAQSGQIIVNPMR